MSGKLIKKVILILVLSIGTVISAVVWFILITFLLVYLDNPTMHLRHLNKPIDSSIVSAKEIEEYLRAELAEINKLRKYDLVIGSVNMTLHAEHRGDVEVIFVEKDNENPKLIRAYLNTEERVFYRFNDLGRESKLNPGILPYDKWKIDSTDTVKIAEDFFRSNVGFRYDKIQMDINNPWSLDGESHWWIALIDEKNNIRYTLRIDLYTGEVWGDAITNTGNGSLS